MVWKTCNGQAFIRPINGVLYRLVESQEQVATLGYVDTLAEQAVLETLLDGVKPPPPEGYEPLHYLLFSPFRYPPLKWGSRFGKSYEPSLCYGGCSLEATLAESAFYRLLYLTSMEGEPPRQSLRSAHAIFSISYATDQGVELQNFPFDAYQAQLTHPTDCSVTQQLGSNMREANIKAFEYTSARSRNGLTCVALYTPAAFVESKPTSIDHWLSETSQNGVAFKGSETKFPVYFQAEQFMINGELPLPA